MPKVAWKCAPVLMVLVLMATGCGSDGDDGESSSPAPEVEGDVCESVDLSTPPEEPTRIRFGHGVAAEEQAWLQFTDPELAGAEHYGTWYEMEAMALNAPERIAAYQAGDLEAGTIGTTELVQARAQGLDLYAVASIVQEAEGAFNTVYAAREDSGITSVEDLKGKSVAIVAPNSNTEYWVLSAVANAGLDPDRDVRLVSVPFPENEAAVRDGQVDVGVFVQPFWAAAEAAGGLTEVFTSLTGPGIDQELLNVWFDRGFVEENPEVYCAWREDYVRATESYLDDRPAAAEALVAADFFFGASAEEYLSVSDWARARDGRIDLDATNTLIDNMVETGFAEEGDVVPAEDLVLDGYSLTE